MHQQVEDNATLEGDQWNCGYSGASVRRADFTVARFALGEPGDYASAHRVAARASQSRQPCSVGEAYGNAMAETFFATLEKELLSEGPFKSQAEGEDCHVPLPGGYNPHRRHSALGYLSPVNFERKLITSNTLAKLTNGPQNRVKSTNVRR